MSNSKKISEFTQETAFLQTDLINIVRNSTNFTVPFSAAATALGVTGTINIVGTAGSPVLEQPSGTVNNIRTLEDGNGILTAISPTNGITISHNFTQDGVGVEIVDDLATASPTFPSFVPGAGMEISRVGDVITWTATGQALPATKVIAVNEIGDFPTSSGGVITLEANTVYVISNDISTSDRFVMGASTIITGYASNGPLLTYTGSGVMFTGVDVGCVFLQLHVSSPNGTTFNFSSSGNHTVVINSVAIDACVNIGTFTSLRALIYDAAVAVSISNNGLTFAGTGWSLISIVDASFVSFNATFVAIDLGVATSSNIDILNTTFIYVSGAIAIKGAASDANLVSGGFGFIDKASFVGAGTELSGLVVADNVRWDFQSNQGIEDTMIDALLSMQGNAAATVIGTQSVGVLVAGTWVIEQVSQMTGTTAGRATYNPARDARTPLTASVTIEPVSGGAQTMGVMIAINGTPVANSLRVSDTSSGTPITISCPWQETLTNGDFVEIYVTNESDTTNVLVSSAILRVN